MTRLNEAIDKARADGYFIRPTDHQDFSEAEATALLEINKALFDRCEYDEIQPAVTAAGNNDRVVVMPGLYEEPTARSKPTYDPACDQYKMPAESGDPGALSHDYQFHCPNDANLVAVIGRGPDTGCTAAAAEVRTVTASRTRVRASGATSSSRDPASAPTTSWSRPATPARATAARPRSGTRRTSASSPTGPTGSCCATSPCATRASTTSTSWRPTATCSTGSRRSTPARTACSRSWRTTGSCRTARPPATATRACTPARALIPWAAIDTSRSTRRHRFSQVVRWCDAHHNTGGFSGTDSHGTQITENNFYDNALGYTTDVFTAPGHPGFPQHGNVVEKNNFYSNNFNPFQRRHRRGAVHPGTGRHRHVDRRRQRERRQEQPLLRQLAARRDALRGAGRPRLRPAPVGSSTPVPGCNLLGLSTSHENSSTTTRWA